MWHDINERNPRYVSPRLKSLGTPTLGLNLVELRGMNGYAPAWLVARPKAARDRAFARAIRADKAENFTLADFEGDLVDRQETTEALGQPLDCEHLQRMA